MHEQVLEVVTKGENVRGVTSGGGCPWGYVRDKMSGSRDHGYEANV